MSECNADLGHPCDAGPDETPCERCAASIASSRAEALREWSARQSRQSERRRYAQDMRDAGRAHLLSADERELEVATRYLVATDDRGTEVRGEAASFDAAYDLALSLGGHLFVVPILGTGAGRAPRVGSVEYVEAVQS